MERQKIFLVSLAAVALLVSAGIFLGDSNRDSPESLEVDSSEVKVTDEGIRYTVHPDKLVQGCPSMDCIPSIDDPSFETGNPGWLEAEARVIGVEIDGESRAYPLSILSRHEIVNDEVGGEPIAVTYCPLCRSGVTYSREVDGETLEFGVSGKLLDANLVMYDRSSQSYWNQITGKAIIGPRASQELQLKFSSITTWGEWKEGHPDTEVLSRNTGIYPASAYDRNPYAGYDSSERVGFGVNNVDDRLPSKELVYGIRLGNESKAYTEDAIREQDIIQDSLAGSPVLLIERPDDGTITAFVREAGEEKLNFTLEDNGLKDSGENAWNFRGEEVDGDRKMERLNPQGFYWFAWSKFHPDTKLYKG